MQKLIISLLVLFPAASFACEEMIAPERVFETLGKDFATFDDYDIVKYAIANADFDEADTNKDGRLTVEEIRADQQAYYQKCAAAQTQ